MNFVLLIGLVAAMATFVHGATYRIYHPYNYAMNSQQIYPNVYYPQYRRPSTIVPSYIGYNNTPKNLPQNGSIYLYRDRSPNINIRNRVHGHGSPKLSNAVVFNKSNGQQY